MKQIVLFFIASCLFAACAKDTVRTAAPADDPFVKIDSAINGYYDACSDIAFADTRSTLSMVNRLRERGQCEEADALYEEAKANYEQNLDSYKQMMSQKDIADRMTKDHGIRLLDGVQV